MLININETRLNIEEKGSGPVLLMLHGYPLSLEMWRPQVDFLSASYKVITFDFRGHGQSDPAPSPYTMNLLASDCAAVLQVLGVERPAVVCGLSMGGYVALAFYREYPSLAGGLILTATRAGADSPEGKINRDKAAALAVEKGTDVVIEGMLPLLLAPKTYDERPGLVRDVEAIMGQTSLEGMVGALMGMKLRPDSTPFLREIAVPTLIIHGADDQIIPTSEPESMHASIPGSTLEIIPDSGHLLNMEQSQLFNQAVQGFLDNFSR
jgi:3-oxoadipate enol-lactonase